MRIQEASLTAADNPEESALSGWFRGGSTPRGMSAIRINVEEASSASREDFVRDVSPLITLDDAAAPYLAKARRAFLAAEDRITRKSRVCSEALPLLLLSSSPLFVGRRLSISSFLPQFRRLLPLLISDLRSPTRDSQPRETSRALSRLRDKRSAAIGRETRGGTKERASVIAVRRSMELMRYATDGLNLTADIYI